MPLNIFQDFKGRFLKSETAFQDDFISLDHHGA
jgi:hypothetical protein